jgi:hypothetical protein
MLTSNWWTIATVGVAAIAFVTVLVTKLVCFFAFACSQCAAIFFASTGTKFATCWAIFSPAFVIVIIFYGPIFGKISLIPEQCVGVLV